MLSTKSCLVSTKGTLKKGKRCRHHDNAYCLDLWLIEMIKMSIDNYLCISASHMTSVRSRFTADCLIFISNDLWYPGLVLTSRRPLCEWSFGFQRAIIRWCRSNRERCKEVESYSKVSNKNHPHFFPRFFFTYLIPCIFYCF